VLRWIGADSVAIAPPSAHRLDLDGDRSRLIPVARQDVDARHVPGERHRVCATPVEFRYDEVLSGTRDLLRVGWRHPGQGYW
jgi:hypothetical protein